MAEIGRDRDLVLAPGEYAYVLDTTKGIVNTIAGPQKVSMSNTDQPVVWDKDHFMRTDVERAIRRNAVAPEGFYIALYNPAEEQPKPGSQSVGSTKLQVGHRINIPGPADIALWPGQTAKVILGHHLRSNQYLLAQVYNDQAASANWAEAVVKPKEGEEGTSTIVPNHFAPGQQLIIKGTEVAFFIPPTGIKVVPDADGSFVRDAVTLERLEYCILLDEDGNKRFVQGPDVVFPEPTEAFVTKDNQRKFRAIELNETSGIYVKVIADYTDHQGEHHVGDELFITGKEQAIYFQREEHAIIRYGDQTKHYAVAIPAGEGRYVLNRNTGVITLRKGPDMLLCDPRTEVIVRRVLSPDTAALWYPGNAKVIEINQKLAQTQEAQRQDPTAYTAGLPTASVSNSMNALYSAEEQAIRSRRIAGDTLQRGATFTPPRTITLDTKYEGAVGISVWTGYAVLVMNKTGQRRVVIGPENVLLEYDETLARLELSTGKPKNDTNPFRTVYLRVANNQISDLVSAETKDLVSVQVLLSYRVNFEGDDHEKWFAVENYIKLLCDHLQSKVRNVVKRHGIEQFYANPADIIRDAILGKPVDGKRTGCPFTENNMRVYDVEVLKVTIQTPDVQALLHNAQRKALTDAVSVVQRERQLEIDQRTEVVNRALATLQAESAVLIAEATQRRLEAELASALAKLDAESEVSDKTRVMMRDQADSEIEIQTAKDAARLTLMRQEIELSLEKLKGETEQIAKRAEAVSPDLAAALQTLSDKELAARAAEALAPMAALQGVTPADMLAKLFDGTPLKQVMEGLATRSQLAITK